MEYKYWSWALAVVAFLVHIFGLVFFVLFTLSVICIVLGILTVIYLQYGDVDELLAAQQHVNHPLEAPRTLGLNLSAAPNISSTTTTSTGNHIPLGEEASTTPRYKLHKDNANLDDYGLPLHRKGKTMLTGIKSLDQQIHTILDYIVRDFIASWFSMLSDNREFSEYRARTCMEDSIQNIVSRMRTVQWVPLMTTKLVDHVATHTRMYRLAMQATTTTATKVPAPHDDRNSPQKRGSVAATVSRQPQLLLQPPQPAVSHRRNKSDTDLNWYMTQKATNAAGGGAKFNGGGKVPLHKNQEDEKSLTDPEAKLLNAFFSNCDLYRDECLDERILEKYLTNVMETVLYFTLPEEDFACLPLRTFLATLLANVVAKPLLIMISDPDFINLQVARLFSKEPPPGEYFMKLVRQCTDLSELRACRQLITKEMDLKFKDPNFASELASLRYTQKLIDLRISHLQINKSEFGRIEKERSVPNLPILSLDELLTKELALSYYLDYLSIMNLQKYVIFYLTAQEWRLSTIQCLNEHQMNKARRDDIYKLIRERATNIYTDYLVQTSQNCLNIDSGLAEVLNIKLNDNAIMPEGTWFDSICKFVYEKLKNEDVFLNNFYQSTAYKKLLLELEFMGQNSEHELDAAHMHMDTASDNNSGDLLFDDDIEEEDHEDGDPNENDIKRERGRSDSSSLLDVTNFKHSRSHSDCTGLFVQQKRRASQLDVPTTMLPTVEMTHRAKQNNNRIKDELTVGDGPTERAHSAPAVQRQELPKVSITGGGQPQPSPLQQQRLSAKIINTAIHCEGQYAVYAIQVTVVEENQQKSWHIYRRYSRFLELKKHLSKRFPNVSRIPFPAKKAFQNTQRSVLEHRMSLLNEFLSIVCLQNDEEMYSIMRDFLEPDINDKKIHGGAVIRTIETLVNPLRSGMRTIKNMPDSLVGGITKILLGRGPMKEPSFLGVQPIPLDQSSEYPSLTSALNLLDEVFDLQTRSQWLRRGIINRLLGAPWVSHAANKKILHAAKQMIDVDRIEHLLSTILSSIWPNGVRQKRHNPREDNTKLRTRMAAKISLFALLSDDLKHLVGSETTRSGLLNFFEMCQHKELNMRLALILMDDVLKTLYNVDNMTKHVRA